MRCTPAEMAIAQLGNGAAILVVLFLLAFSPLALSLSPFQVVPSLSCSTGDLSSYVTHFSCSDDPNMRSNAINGTFFHFAKRFTLHFPFFEDESSSRSSDSFFLDKNTHCL